MQTDGAHLPDYVGSVANLNNQPCLHFDSDALSTSNYTGVRGNGDRTVIAVWSNAVQTGQNYQHVLHFGNTNGNEAYGPSAYRGGGTHPIGNHYWGAGFDTTVAGSTNPTVAISMWDGDGGGTAGNGLDSWWVNGNVAGASERAPLNTGLTQLQVGSRLSPFTEGIRGDIAEIIIYDTLLTPEEMNRIGGYIQQKYGITVTGAIFTLGLPPLNPIKGTVSFNDFSDVSSFQFNGSASQVGNRIQLTPSAGSLAGSAFYKSRLVLQDDSSFKADFSFAASNPGNGGADGLTFVIQDSLAGPMALGGAGGAMGLTGGNVDPFLAVRFNDYDPNVYGVRIASTANGDLGTVNLPAFKDGDPRYVWVDYDGATDLMEVYFSIDPTKPGSPTVSATIDLASLFGTDLDLFVGFTAGTGGAFAQHEILSFDFNGAPNPTLIPEPASLSLLGLGLLALARRRRKA